MVGKERESQTKERNIFHVSVETKEQTRVLGESEKSQEPRELLGLHFNLLIRGKGGFYDSLLYVYMYFFMNLIENGSFVGLGLKVMKCHEK